MTFIEQVINHTKHIEARLEALGGSGNGLREKADGVQPPLTQDLMNRIRNIGAVRNAFAHEHGYQYAGDESGFLTYCESVLMELGS